MAEPQTVRGFIVARLPFGNTSLIVRCLSREAGRLTLMAKGATRPKSPFAGQLDLNALGGFIVKGLSREPIEGNPPPRVFEAEAGMINSIGLQNIGVRAFVRDKLPALANLKTAVFANVFGHATEDYVEVVRVLEDVGVLDEEKS